MKTEDNFKALTYTPKFTSERLCYWSAWIYFQENVQKNFKISFLYDEGFKLSL